MNLKPGQRVQAQRVPKGSTDEEVCFDPPGVAGPLDRVTGWNLPLPTCCQMRSGGESVLPARRHSSDAALGSTGNSPGSGPGGSGDCRRWLPEELDVSSGVPNHEPARATPGDSINRSRSLRLRLVAQWRPGSIRAWRGVLRREPFSMGRRERPESESLWHGASRHAGSSAERGSRTVSFGHLPNVACLAWTSRSIA